MAIGDISVTVVPDATDFWRSFQARTSGQADRTGRQEGQSFRRGFQAEADRGAKVRVSADTSAARSDLASLEAEVRGIRIARLQPKFDDKQARAQIVELQSRLAGLSSRPDINTTLARAQLAELRRQINDTKDSERSLDQQGQQSGGGLLAALLPLAPALAPLAGAATAAGAAIGATMASSILAVLGFKNAMQEATNVGSRTAAAVGSVKSALSGLESTAAKAALPGLEQSVSAITTQVPQLRKIVSQEAGVGGEVLAHLTRGVLGEVKNLGPVLGAVGGDVDTLAAHFETWATGPGGARFAQTLASDYRKVRPEIISVEKAVADLLAAGSSSGLGIVSLIGDLARMIDSFPRPVLTAIVDGLLAFKAVSLASTAVTAIRGAFSGLTGAAQRAAAATQLAATQRAAAETAAAAATAEAEATAAEAMLATAAAAREELLAVATSRGQLSANQTAAMQVQIGIADREIASYAEVATAARAAAAQQTAAAEEAAAARAAAVESAGASSVAGVAGGLLGPVGLAVGGLLLLTTAFGDNGKAAQQDAAQVDGYASALVNTRGALDSTVRAQVAKTLADGGALELARKAGVAQDTLTSAIISGGSALTSAKSQIDAYMRSQGKSQIVIDAVNNGLDHQNVLFQKGVQSAKDQTAATDAISAATRAHAAALHTTVGVYLAAQNATAGSVEKTREQTVAFQLANDAASLLSNALKALAGQNLGVAQAETSYQQSIHATIAALKKGHDAILGNSDAALTNQQAIQGSVSAARQYADAVAQQTGSSAKAATAYRNSRDALLHQLQAQGQLTPAVRKYINTLFDVKGVSDYLSKHPTKLDADKKAADAKLHTLQTEINNIKQGRIPALTLNGNEAANQISRIQGMIDALHGKTVTITTISANGGSVSVGSGGRGYSASAAGSASWTRDGKLPPGLSTVGERGWELVSTDSAGRSQVYSHAQSVAMTGMPGTLPGFAAGTGLPLTARQIAAALSDAFKFGRNQIAGVLGNLKVESGFRSTAYNARENAHGFAQWEGARWTALQKYAKGLGESATGTKAQIGFLVKELRGSGIASAIKGMSDPAKIAALVDARYERSSGSMRGRRESAAVQIAAALKGVNLAKVPGVSPLPLPPLHAGPSIHSLMPAATKTVLSQIAAAVKPPVTSVSGLSRALGSQTGTAATQLAKSRSDAAVYHEAAAQATNLQHRLDALKASSRGAWEAAKNHATALQNQARAASQAASRMGSATDADKAAKAAARAHAQELSNEAHAAQQYATSLSRGNTDGQKALQAQVTAAKKRAAALKTIWDKQSQAAKDAEQKAADTAKSLIQTVSDEATALLQKVADFESTIASGIAQGSDLATVWGNLATSTADANQAIYGGINISDLWTGAVQSQTDAATNLADAQQAVADAQKAINDAMPDTNALAGARAAQEGAQAVYDAAHARLAAAQAAVAGGVGTPAQYAAVTTAQQAQSDAVSGLADANTRLTAAQQAVAQATGPTTDQIQALTDAQTKLAAAQTAATAAGTGQAAGLQDTFAAWRQQITAAAGFATDLGALSAHGLNASLIGQIRAMGPAIGDALAEAIIAGGPAAVTQANTLSAQVAAALTAPPTDAELQAQFKSVLAGAQTFASDLTRLAGEGGNQDLLTQIAGMGPDAGDQLAKAILAAGPGGIKALQATMGQISKVAGTEGDALGGVFFSKGEGAMAQLIAGLEARFPDLKAALAPIAALVDQTLNAEDKGGKAAGTTKSATTKYAHALSYLATAYKTSVATLVALNPSLAGDTSKTIIGKGTKLTIPAFAAGVKNFRGGYALVGEHGPEITWLPPHSNVYRNGTTPTVDMGGVVDELRTLNTRVDTLAGRIGQEVAIRGAVLYESAGRASGRAQTRAYRKGSY